MKTRLIHAIIGGLIGLLLVFSGGCVAYTYPTGPVVVAPAPAVEVEVTPVWIPGPFWYGGIYYPRGGWHSGHRR